MVKLLLSGKSLKCYEADKEKNGRRKISRFVARPRGDKMLSSVKPQINGTRWKMDRFVMCKFSLRKKLKNLARKFILANKKLVLIACGRVV